MDKIDQCIFLAFNYTENDENVGKKNIIILNVFIYRMDCVNMYYLCQNIVHFLPMFVLNKG